MEFTLESTGFDDVTARLLRFENISRNMRPLLEMVALRVHGELLKQMATQGAHAGTKWAPLAPSTLARKAALGQPPVPLFATGALSRSLTMENAPGAIHKVTADFARVGTSDPKAVFHQHGTRNMPARPPVKLKPGFSREVAKRLQRWLVEGDLRWPT